QVDGAFGDGRDRDRARARLAGARVVEQATHDLVDATRLSLRRLDELLLGWAHPLAEHGEVAEHGAERVADLVGDASAEPADRGQLLRADELVPRFGEEAVRLLERG